MSGRALQVPEEYQDRESTYLKHLVLKEYLRKWGHKLGSRGRRSRVDLWYVDCFAGPWNAKSDDLRDTSISIGLRAIREARETWAGLDAEIEVHAAFVEKDPSAYKRLRDHLESTGDGIDLHALRGEFGENVEKLTKLVGQDPAFIFVDPTGWKGAGMDFIKPLVEPPFRDVMMNVMSNHVVRFHADPREWLRGQMRDFFGLDEHSLLEQMPEPELLKFYCDRLKQKTALKFVADLCVPDPSKERVKFRLVVGGQSPEVLAVFRDVEEQVVGKLAGTVRDDAKRRQREKKSGMLEFGLEPPSADSFYGELHEAGLASAQELLVDAARDGGVLYDDVWPGILESCHITLKDLGNVAARLATDGEIRIEGLKGRERNPKPRKRHRILPSD